LTPPHRAPILKRFGHRAHARADPAGRVQEAVRRGCGLGVW
jgi:hypothetical protein